MGKELKVVESQLTFGQKARMVNVFGVFRYQKNHNLYILYSDVDNNYPVVYYGSSHVKDRSVLCMSCREEDSEVIKEFIFKTCHKENLDDFEMISLDEVDSIEIISSNRLEIESDIFMSLVDLTIPKREVKVSSKSDSPKKKSGISKIFLFLIFIFVIGFSVYYYFSSMSSGNEDARVISCSKTSSNRSLNANVEETSLYYFNVSDILDRVETTMVYSFSEREDYENFIYRGTMYKYMPDDGDGGFNTDDEKQTFTVISKEDVDSHYDKPVRYEEVLSYYKKDGYTCDEKLLGE